MAARLGIGKLAAAELDHEHPAPRLVVPDRHVRPDALDQAANAAALGLGERVGPRVVAARRRNASLPPVGEVAVEVDAVGVLASVGGDAIRVDRLDDPEIDAAGVAVVVPQDVHDLVTLGLVTVDRADGQPRALRLGIADAHGDELPPVHRVPELHMADRRAGLRSEEARYRRERGGSGREQRRAHSPSYSRAARALSTSSVAITS